MNFDFEVSRVDCNFLKEKLKVSTLNILMLNITYFLSVSLSKKMSRKGEYQDGHISAYNQLPVLFLHMQALCA